MSTVCDDWPMCKCGDELQAEFLANGNGVTFAKLVRDTLLQRRCNVTVDEHDSVSGWDTLSGDSTQIDLFGDPAGSWEPPW